MIGLGTREVQNHASLGVSLLPWTMSMPEVFRILGTHVLGMLSCWELVELIKRLF
jgi:uncharacterized integral membrane protein